MCTEIKASDLLNEKKKMQKISVERKKNSGFFSNPINAM